MEHIGTLFGLMYAVAGAFSYLQYPLFKWAENSSHRAVSVKY